MPQRTVEALRKNLPKTWAPQVEHITVDSNVAIVAVVGENMREPPESPEKHSTRWPRKREI